MSDQLFNMNRLNRRIISLMGLLHGLSALSQAVIEDPTEDTSGSLSVAVELFAQESEAMLASLWTLLSQLQGDSDIIDVKGDPAEGFEI